MSLIAIILVAFFFVSGADAASVVMGMLSSRGNINPQAWIVVIWGTLTGAAAAILLLAGGLEGLQTAAILSAAPFCARDDRAVLVPLQGAAHRTGAGRNPGYRGAGVGQGDVPPPGSQRTAADGQGGFRVAWSAKA